MDYPGLLLACLAAGTVALGLILAVVAVSAGRNALGERTPEGMTVGLGLALIFGVLAALLMFGPASPSGWYSK